MIATPPRRTSTRLGAGLAALLLLALGACSSEDDEPSPVTSGDSVSPSAPSSSGSSSDAPPSPESSATGPVPAPGSFPSYVALGDSYTAAPLAGETDTTNPCLRSAGNYPALVAQAIEGSDLVDVSCSGADTTSLIGIQQTQNGTLPAQFDALKPDTSLVTIGIGGNDFSIFSTLVGTCTTVAETDPTGAPCQAQNNATGTDALLADVDMLGERLTSTIAGIRDRSPAATIVVVGYPDSIPGDGTTCPDLLPLATGDYAYAASINKALASVQKKAAQKAGVIYIDTFAASQGHDICSTDPWINGAVTSASTALAFHPLEAEQRAVADLVLAALAETDQGKGAGA